jgi:hypothetical protein
LDRWEAGIESLDLACEDKRVVENIYDDAPYFPRHHYATEAIRGLLEFCLLRCPFNPKTDFHGRNRERLKSPDFTIRDVGQRLNVWQVSTGAIQAMNVGY